MLEAEEVTTRPPSLPATNNVAISACRLCLKEQTELQTDIFAETQNTENEFGTSLAQHLYDLFQVKYENVKQLPHGICERCCFMVKAFTCFRDNLQKCENELQKRYKALKVQMQKHFLRAGLNDQPGLFIPDEDCEITEVDPEQEYESSEDDFSMESESETEASKISNNQHSASVNNAPAAVPSAVTETRNNLLQTLEAPIKTLCFLCQYCDMAFTTQPDCLEHETHQHDSLLPFTCNFCQIRHSSRQFIIAHIRQQHQPDRPYVCTLCGKCFCRRSDLKKHTIVHTGVRPYTCPLCTKSFSRNTNLTKHMRIHSSVKPHVCQLCPRSFGTANELIQHTRAHSDLKPYQCDRCPAAYTRRDKLHMHQMSHLRRENEKQMLMMPQMAAETKDAFKSSAQPEKDPAYYGETTALEAGQHSILAAHLLQQQQRGGLTMQQPKSSRSFNCTICGKFFMREQDLQRHQALHLDDLYTCKQCNRGFARSEKLARHMLEQHGPTHNSDISSAGDPYDMNMKMHEMQQHFEINTQAAAAGNGLETLVPQDMGIDLLQQTQLLAPPAIQASAQDISFCSQVPTMNLGFYSETRPEDNNTF